MKAMRLSVLVLLLLASCAAGADATRTIQVKIKDQPFTLELALTADQREKGLMFRDSMPADRGMLFVFAKAYPWTFWMHNTRIPLDIIFLDPDQKVVDIQTRRAYDETSRAPRAPALYVIELNAGAAARLGLKVGDTVALPVKELKQLESGAEKQQ